MGNQSYVARSLQNVRINPLESQQEVGGGSAERQGALQATVCNEIDPAAMESVGSP